MESAHVVMIVWNELVPHSSNSDHRHLFPSCNKTFGLLPKTGPLCEVHVDSCLGTLDAVDVFLLLR